MLAPRLNSDCAGRALDRVLDAFGEADGTNQLASLAQAATALVQTGARVDADRAVNALDFALEAFDLTPDDDELESLARAIAPLVALVASGEPAVATIANRLKIPGFAIDTLDQTLIAWLRTRHGDMPSVENGFWAAIDWLSHRYPNLDFDGPPR
jgi:hypothetical protein